MPLASSSGHPRPTLWVPRMLAKHMTADVAHMSRVPFHSESVPPLHAVCEARGGVWASGVLPETKKVRVMKLERLGNTRVLVRGNKIFFTHPDYRILHSAVQHFSTIRIVLNLLVVLEYKFSIHERNGCFGRHLHNWRNHIYKPHLFQLLVYSN